MNLYGQQTLFKNISTQSVCLFALEIRCTVCSYGTSTAYFVTYVTIRGTMNYVHRKASVLAHFSYLLIFVFVLTQNFIKNIPNVDFMAILMKLATCHVLNTFERPLRPNAPTTSANKCHFEGNWMGFQKIIPYKNPRHGAPGSIGSSKSTINMFEYYGK